jgi:hypothetical protein
MSLLQRQICLQMELPPSRGSSSPVPLIRMVYEANPAAISHQVSGRLPLHLCFNNTIDTMLRCVLTVSRGCKLKDPGNGRQFCTMRSGSLENIRLAHSYCPENISVKAADSSCPTFICDRCCYQVRNAVRWLWRRAFLKHYPAGAAEAFN